MSPGFAVDLELLQAMVDRMASFEQQAATVQGDVATRMQRVHAVWQGAAAAEAATAHQRWAAGASEMHDALVVLRSIASIAHGNYCSEVQTNLRMWAV